MRDPADYSDQVIEDLWRSALVLGDLTVSSRRDSKGDYVQVKCTSPEGIEVVCTSDTVPRALRAIAGWHHNFFYVIEAQVPRPNDKKKWNAISWTHYANGIAAAKALKRMEAQHPLIRFRIVVRRFVVPR
jgi:hypothetical protein